MSGSRFKEYDPLSCLNCGEQFEREVSFCPTCGQKNRKNELSLAEWIREALSTFFHLEGKTLNTVRDLTVPGKMATNYFNGQRQRYVHPFRLLVFSSLICFGLMSIQRAYFPTDVDAIVQLRFKDSDVNSVSIGDSISTEVMKNANEHPIASQMKAIDLLRARIIHHDRFELIADSLSRVESLQDSSQLALLDTLRTFYKMPDSWLGSGFFVTNGDTLDFDARKVVSMSAADIVAESDVKGWIQKLIARKGIDAYREGSASVFEQLYGNLSWAVLIFVPFLALGYKLFYRKKLPLYTQHLTYSAILMSIALLLYGASTLIDALLPFKVVSLTSLLVFLVYNLFSDSRTFQVSKLHAFAKFNLLAIYGFVSFMISLLIWLFGTMLFV